MTRPMRVVILGGGTAGWMTAAGLVGLLPPGTCDIRLIESEAIGTVGVGEATLPQMRAFNTAIGLIEADLVRRTNATFKLGIEFVGWGAPDGRYIHPFGAFGRPLGGVAFHHQWMRAAEAGDARPLQAYSLAVAAARADRFDFPASEPGTIASTFDYAYHFDASLYAAMLRELAERRGVARTEGRICDVRLDPHSGSVAAIRMENGDEIEGDLFVDCTGFRALLLGEALEVGYEDWSHWLPCDRAIALPSDRLEVLPPCTRATARSAGWQWRIPLQHRTGNGYIYASAFTSDDEAHELLAASLPSGGAGTARQLRFRPGRRVRSWARNCVGIGLSSGFLEPLESTSIYLIQVAITNLVALFPRHPADPALAAEFDRRMDTEYARIRDFLILHYHANGRSEPMWRHCRDMAVPDTLTDTMALFRHRGAVPKYRDGLFSPASWLSLFFGQGFAPAAGHPLADGMPLAEVQAMLRRMEREIDDAVASMPRHDTFVDDYAAIAAFPGLAR